MERPCITYQFGIMRIWLDGTKTRRFALIEKRIRLKIIEK